MTNEQFIVGGAVDRYYAEMETLLRKPFDAATMMAFAKKHEIKLPSNHKAMEIAYHKMRAALGCLPQKLQDESRAWLERGGWVPRTVEELLDLLSPRHPR